MHEVEKSYVVPVDPDKLVTGALKGMLSRLDPHSDYMSEREYHDLVATTSGQFGGVGIEISVEDGVPQVVAAIDGTPASVAGVEPGDRIIKADGQPTVGMDIEEVVRRLRGAPGTRVVLTIARADREPFEVPDRARGDPCRVGQVGAEAGRGRLCPGQHLRRQQQRRAARRDRPGQARGRRPAFRVCPRSAQRCRRPARRGDRCRQRLPRFRHGGDDPRPRPRREPHLRRAGRRRPACAACRWSC